MPGRPGRAKRRRRLASRVSIAKLRPGQAQEEILEADGCNLQTHRLLGSTDDLLQRLEEMDGACNKKPHYSVGVLDTAYAACSFDRGEVSSGRQAPHFDGLRALQIGEKSIKGAHR